MTEALFDRKLKCLFCDQSFTSKKIRDSKIRIDKKDADFCIHYKGENPYYYEVNVCPHCSFAFTGNSAQLEIDQKDMLQREFIDRIDNIDLCGPRTCEDAIMSFKLALLCANFIEAPRINVAGIFMRLAWLNRYCGCKDEEMKYLSKALPIYEYVYENEDLSKISMSGTKLLYLIGELNGRLGFFTKARKWFAALFTQGNIEPALNKLARDRWQDYKSMMEEEKCKDTIEVANEA